ncbi:hypothetical protein MP228_005244 [Amoeboaphelidium protococcarum]|nr:hypothetical protein MP228_005244 [Amoeboaphelidium protococcarum]
MYFQSIILVCSSWYMIHAMHGQSSRSSYRWTDATEQSTQAPLVMPPFEDAGEMNQPIKEYLDVAKQTHQAQAQGITPSYPTLVVGTFETACKQGNVEFVLHALEKYFVADEVDETRCVTYAFQHKHLNLIEALYGHYSKSASYTKRDFIDNVIMKLLVESGGNGKFQSEVKAMLNLTPEKFDELALGIIQQQRLDEEKGKDRFLYYSREHMKDKAEHEYKAVYDMVMNCRIDDYVANYERMEQQFRFTAYFANSKIMEMCESSEVAKLLDFLLPLNLEEYDWQLLFGNFFRTKRQALYKYILTRPNTPSKALAAVQKMGEWRKELQQYN